MIFSSHEQMSGLNRRAYSNQLNKWWKEFYGLDDFMVALYVWPNHADDGIYSDHGFLDTLEIPLGPP